MKKLKEILVLLFFVALGVTLSRLFPMTASILLIAYVVIYVINSVYKTIKSK